MPLKVIKLVIDLLFDWMYKSRKPNKVPTAEIIHIHNLKILTHKPV